MQPWREEFELDGVKSGSLLTNNDISLIRRGKLCCSCVRSSMLHGSEALPVRIENEMALQMEEMRTVRWMCGVKFKDRVSNKELRERDWE